MVTHSHRITKSDTLKALAHPMRQRIIVELTVRHSARAVDLAAILGEPANAVSYHLRALAKAELVVEAPELARDSRDRVWKVAHPEGLYVAAEDLERVDGLFENEFLTWTRRMLNQTLSKDPRATRAQYSGGALLTKDESSKMFMEVAEVLERWRMHGMDADAANPHDPDRVFHYIVALVGNRDDETPNTLTAQD
ncbi:MAG: helix-turn-helix domain-containing protein [Terrimesophilobacter sp.]